MPFSGINYLAIVIAAVAAWLAGAAWYMALGKPWMAALGITPEQMEAAKKEPGAYLPFLYCFVAELVMAWVLAGVLGHIGVTAYVGVLEVARPQPGETFCVSAAAGSVGSVAGQIAKMQGATVIGIAGSPAKCAWVTEDLGFDACIDYKREDVAARLKELAPKGVEISHRNLLIACRAYARVCLIDADTVMLNALPSFHIAGVENTLTTLIEGGMTLHHPQFDARAVIEAIVAGQASVVIGFYLHLYLSGIQGAHGTQIPGFVLNGLPIEVLHDLRRGATGRTVRIVAVYNFAWLVG